MWYKEYQTSPGNTLATRRMIPRFLFILAMIADIWLDQVKFSLMIIPKNFNERDLSNYYRIYLNFSPKGIFLWVLRKIM